MFADLSQMVKEQEVTFLIFHVAMCIVVYDKENLLNCEQSEIGQIYGNIEESHAKTKEAFANVIEANRLQQSGNCIIS